MKSGRTQVELIALYEELGSYRAVGALLGCDHKTCRAPGSDRTLV